MPELKPLAAVRFADSAGGGDISGKIAPPYDVLDAGPKADMLARDPHNVVAIDLPVTPPKTVGPDAAYDAAGALYRRWLEEGVLVRDGRPGVVVYEQVYELDGKAVRRRGLFAALGVEEFNRAGGGIFRHEMTIAGGIGDRTKLMEATSAQLSPIFGIFPDPHPRKVGTILDGVCDSREPDFHGTTGSDGVAHRCWRVDDADTLQNLVEFFRDTDVFIADGHHRYTTALQLSKEHPELPGAGACLFVLVAAEDPGMVVLPTHRVVCGLDGLTAADLRVQIERDPRLTLAPSVVAARFGVYVPGEDAPIGIDTTADPLAARFPEKPEVWRTLDVAVLQHLLIDELWGTPRKPTVKYTADIDEMKAMSAAEPGRLGVVMRPTPLESVMQVSRVGEVMPAKSTYFYPKLATGLVVNPLD